MIVALVVIQEMCTRMGAVTGKGLADLIRERFGVKVTFYAMVGLLLGNLGNIMSEFAGVAASMELFGVSKYVSLPLAALFIWWLVLRWSYKVVERVFLAACLIYFCYLFSGYLAHPQWGEVGRELLVPSFSFDSHYLVILVGVIGTTIAPWMQFYQQAAVVEKRIDVDELRYTRIDVVLGCIVTDVVAFSIVMACAATLFKAGVTVETADQAALALEPLAGRYAAWLFAFGLFNASFFAAAILPLSTAYYVCEAFGWESGIDKKYGEAKQFYWLYTSILVVGALVVLWPRLPLVQIMLVSQILNGILLPFILVFMLILVNREKIMGEWRNGRFFNAVAWGTTAIMIALTLWLVVAGIRELGA